MKKSDLKFGMVVELKSGDLCLIEPTANCDDVSIKNYLKNNRFNEHDVRFRNIKTCCWESSLSNFNSNLTNDIDKYSIIKVYKDYTLLKVLWERKELLTDEERDWLAAVIKPFRDKVAYIAKQGCLDDYMLTIRINNDDRLASPQIENMLLKFKGLKLDIVYSLDELGL